MMWGPGPWAWSYWWICPLIGLAMLAVFILVMMRALRGGHGMMCMGGHGRGPADPHADLQREVRDLRGEVDKLRAAR